ncbi:unnamed protein product [Owenia fusiformis]|uniref:Galactosylgalactosylxylosylprotein 3-beta-glucuronosyltransferase n=1 Tax=Owenia fusiformis TaxID=6347 RepID=A0A8S4NLN3_OWEFU|nr:unnamed protein product [Owenia fusiformis]
MEEIKGKTRTIVLRSDATSTSTQDQIHFSAKEMDKLTETVTRLDIDKPGEKNTRSPPKIFAITPTYRRPQQIAEFTRLGQSLMNVADLHWIVIEDDVTQSRRIVQLLNRLNIEFTLLAIPSDTSLQSTVKGITQRNAGLKLLLDANFTGVFYFADDDNSYDLRIFEQMKSIKRVGVWPVGLVTGQGFESPIVKNGKVVDFSSGWKANRAFPLDMAGFAVNIDFWQQKGAPLFYRKVNPGYQEDIFLKELHIEKQDLEPLAWNCSKILTWHTKTYHTKIDPPKLQRKTVSKTNIEKLIDQIPSNKVKSKDEKVVTFQDGNPLIVTSHKQLYTKSMVISAMGENNLNRTRILSAQDFEWMLSNFKTISLIKTSTRQDASTTGVEGNANDTRLVDKNNGSIMNITQQNGFNKLKVIGNATKS